MTACPSRKTLLSYEHGELADGEVGDLERHLSDCESCRTLLEQLRATDPDTHLIRRVLQFTHGVVAVGDEADPEPRTPVAGEAAMHDAEACIAPDYERIALCGEGSFGSVWAVRDRAGVHRAMKIIEVDRLARAGVAYDELDALKAYCGKVERHPHLIMVHHIGLSGGCLYYTMELADDLGTRSAVRHQLPADYRAFTLKALMDAQAIPLDASVEIVRRILQGLARLHELDLLHRDVKPSNIVFVNRNPKLADIGIVAGMEAAQRSIGTPRYMPPDKAKDKTADVYAAGRVLDELVRPRAFKDADQKVATKSSQWDMERVRAVIVRACASNAAERYPTAAAMLDDLEACRVISPDSPFDELVWAAPAVRPSSWQGALQLGFAFVNRIPWLVGLIVVLYALSLLRR